MYWYSLIRVFLFESFSNLNTCKKNKQKEIIVLYFYKKQNAKQADNILHVANKSLYNWELNLN